jgi:peptide/nickel transport system substrate-binding protein
MAQIHRPARRRVAALVLALGLVAAACGGDDSSSSSNDQGSTDNTEQASRSPRKGGELTIGTESDVASLDVGVAAQPADKDITLGIFDPLMTWKDGKIVPYLAKSLTPSDDLTTYELVLPTGVAFQDGTKLDADSVVKHFNRLKDPATACPCQNSVAVIASMDTPDGPTGSKVTFHMAAPNVAFPELLTESSGYIESPAAVAKYGADFKNHPVGTGPFVLAEYTPGERVVLTANPSYWQKDDDGIQLPYLDKVTFVPIPDSGQRVTALKTGTIDMFQTADSATLAQATKDGFAAQKISGSSSTVILFNNSKPPFNDVRARQAVAYAVNKDVLNERIYSGVREPSYSAFATDSPYYNKDAGTPKYDLDKAKQLVKDLGGLKFTLESIPTPEANQILQLVKQMGEQAGMQIELKTQEQGAYVNRIFGKGGDYEAACFRTAHFIEPDAWRTGIYTGDTGNLVFYSNKKVDQLLDDARETSDFDQRKKDYFEAQKITGEEVPALTTLYDLFGNVYNKDKVGPMPEPEANSLGALKPGFLYVTK